MADSVNLDQTAPLDVNTDTLRAVFSGFTLSDQANLSKYFEQIRYV